MRRNCVNSHCTLKISEHTARVITYIYMFGMFLHQASGQLCLYNYTISSGQTIVVTQNASVCLICSQNSSNQWTISSVRYTPVLNASYILHVSEPNKTLNAVPVMCTSRIQSTVFIAIPVYPPVVTYVVESAKLSLLCSSVITVSGLAIIDQKWLNPTGETVSEFSNYDMQPVYRSSAGVYTCVTFLVSNNQGLESVNTSTQVVVYDPSKINELQDNTSVIQGHREDF